MTPKQANELMQSIQDLQDLQKKTIVEKSDDQKRAALESFVREALFANGPELMATWVAMEKEYKPLLMGFASLLGRASEILEARQQAAEKAAK